ncbi:MAG: hypothetical protein AAGA54_30980 [Myxococcota bacterium]
MFRALVVATLLLGGCLTNLNEQKYFERLDALDPATAAVVRSHKGAIEETLHAAIVEAAPAPPTAVGLWGATWDAVREPILDGKLYMRGRVFYDGRRSSPYKLVYEVADDGAVTVVFVEVFG